MTTPNMIYIGPPKAGSTWLHHALSRHPDVYLTNAKELHYFDRFYHRGSDWYLKHFEKAEYSSKIVGEISHDYLYSNEACDRIARDLGNVLLLVTLREPVERAFSDFLFMVKQGYVHNDFESAIEKHPEILEHSRYAKYLAPYVEKFGRDSLVFLVFDDLKEDPLSFYRHLCTKLGLSAEKAGNELTRQVLPAAAPRNVIVARLAKWAAVRLRQAGFTTSITQIKGSRFLQTLLYRSYGHAEKPTLGPDCNKRLREYFEEDVFELDRAILPGIARRWGYG